MMAASKKRHTQKTLNQDMFDKLVAEDIKKDADIVLLFQDFGVKLDKKGISYSGLCPWHDDKNPSLSVSREKGLYNCYACGESGDQITLVQKMKGLSYREACEYLKKNNQKESSFIMGLNEKSLPLKPEEKKEEVETDLALTLSELEGTDLTDKDTPYFSEISLNTIAEHYHKKLFENTNAKKYLEARGIKNASVISRYKLGFSDGSIVNLIGTSQIEALKKLSILKDSDDTQEYFKGYITIPLFDEADQTVGFYGRSTDPRSKIPHLYLKGKHKSVFNRKASKVYDEIILTESIIDALSLIELGIDNVQSIYGVNGFTDEHLTILKSDRVKMVILAFDKDEAGIKAGETIKEKLLTEGFKVKIITPPVCKDWNEELISRITKDQVKALIGNAVLFEPKKSAKESFLVTKDHEIYHFKVDDITYRISGVKEIFINDLKIQIRAQVDEENYHHDRVDLIAYRSRVKFSSDTAGKLGVNAVKVEKDLDKILLYLEKERDKNLNAGKDEKPELTEEEIELGMNFLKRTTLLDDIVNDITALGYIGEDLNKLLIYLCASSRKLDDPISVLISSQSAGGKSYMVETVSRLIPPEDVFEFDTGSDQALQYTGARLMHKFLVMGEDKHNDKIEHQLREILSRHRVTRWIASKDEKTGEIDSKQIIVEATVANVISTTSDQIHPENATRYFIINTDESKRQTDYIYENQKEKYSEEKEEERRLVIPPIIERHHAAQRLLKKRVIIMSQSLRDAIAFPNHLMRFRRDHMRFLDLIACVCFVRQYQKQIKNNGKFEYIECDYTDYETAYRLLVNTVMLSTGSEIARQAVTLYDEVRSVIRKKSQKDGIKILETGISQRKIREETDFSQMYVKRYLRVLADYEYLKKSGANARGERGQYYLVKDESIQNIDLSMIPSPEAVKKIFEDEAKSGSSGSKKK